MKKMTKKEKIKALEELIKTRDLSAWEGVEKYRKEHGGQLPPQTRTEEKV